jgi:hypothetical protein
VKREFVLGQYISTITNVETKNTQNGIKKQKKNILDKCSLELIFVFSFPSLDTQVYQQLMHIQVTV